MAIVRRSWARRIRRLGVGTALALMSMPGPVAAGAEAPAPEPSRFRLEGGLRPLAISACGRFALDATVRFTPEATSADGRFTMKSVHVPKAGCDPFPDPLFSDGFEEQDP